jgi:uncharacterized membrane protein YfcA
MVLWSKLRSSRFFLHLSLVQWLVLSLAAFGVGLSKTGIAGFGIVAVALFAVAIPAKESIGIVLPLLICGDICAVTIYRRKAVWKHLVGLLPWAIVGVVIGYFALGHIESNQVGLLIGIILIVLAVFQAVRRIQADKSKAVSNTVDPAGTKHNTITEAGAGMLAGSTTMIANAAGPVMVIYLLATGLPKVEFVGTGAWFFFILNLIKVPFSAKLGLVNDHSLLLDLKLVPDVLIGALVGKIIVQKIDQRQFEYLAILLTMAAAVRLVIVGLAQYTMASGRVP